MREKTCSVNASLPKHPADGSSHNDETSESKRDEDWRGGVRKERGVTGLLGFAIQEN